MKSDIKNIFINPLVAGSFFLFLGGIIASFFNFLFNILMSRNLPVEDYGILISLISIVTLLAIPSGAITPTVVTVAGGYFTKNDRAHLHAFYLKLFKALVGIGIMLFLVFFLFSGILADFFKIENTILLSFAIAGVVLSYLLTLSNSFLQAKLAFRFLSFSNSVAAFLKVLLAFSLVLFGWGTLGALFGFLISLAITILLGVYYFRNFIFYKSKDLPKISYKDLLSYGVPSAIVIFSLNALVSSDILLVKHLFSSYQAGLYAGLSLVGRVVFFIGAPIGTVMFSVIVKRISNSQGYRLILFLSIAMVTTLSLSISIFYYLFPEFSIIFFLKKEEYLPVSVNLFRFSIFITLYSIVSLMAYYFLSIKKTAFSVVMLLAAMLQIVLIYTYHDNFDQVINISIMVCILILISSAIIQRFKN